MQKLIPSNTIIDIENQIKQERAAKSIIEKMKKRERKMKMQPYKASDGKTTFYCSTPEKGKAAVERYERRLRKFTGL